MIKQLVRPGLSLLIGLIIATGVAGSAMASPSGTAATMHANAATLYANAAAHAAALRTSVAP
jgi:hypothetical protein